MALPAPRTRGRRHPGANDRRGRPHPDFVALYGWHDGYDRFQVPVSDNGLVSLMPSHQEFNPLAETVDEFALWRRIAESMAAAAAVKDRKPVQGPVRPGDLRPGAG